MGCGSGASGESLPSSETQLTRHDDNQCPQSNEWFCFNTTTKAYNCSQIQSVLWPDENFFKCFESGPAMLLGACATYDEDTRILSILPWCGYFQYGAYNITVTVLYFVVIAFQIRLTVPPMPCLIMFALLCRIGFDTFHPIGKLVPMYETKDGRLRLVDTNIAYLLYGMFSLDFFIHVLPPFCISSKLNFYHVTLFGYISAFYLIFLIFLTWLFVELHGRNYRLLRWLWKPFQLCLARIRKQGIIDAKNDLVDILIRHILSPLLPQVFISNSDVLRCISHQY